MPKSGVGLILVRDRGISCLWIIQPALFPDSLGRERV